MRSSNMDHLTRQMDIIPVTTLGQAITVIGAGAIGSFTVLSLVKMGFENVTVYDFDDVSVENMNCQWYRLQDIGKKKAEALRDLIREFTGVDINAVSERFQEQPLRGIVITAVDSMAARRHIWERIKATPSAKILIDPRMAAEYALAYVMNPADHKDVLSYEKVLYTDDEAVQERCTAKATMYTSTMIAGYVAKAVKDVVTGGKYARVSHWDIGMNNLLNWGKGH